MICAHCQASNIDGTAFCEACGAPLLTLAPVAPPIHPSSAGTMSGAGAANSAAQMITLVVSSPAGEKRVPFNGQELLCGRRDERLRIFPEIALDDPAASRRHLALFLEAGKFCVQDLESGNGTKLNQVPIASGVPVEVHHGDVLSIGEHVTIRVEMM